MKSIVTEGKSGQNLEEFMIRTVIVILSLVRFSASYSYVHRKWDFLLPHDIMRQLYSIEANTQLNEMEAESLIDSVLSRLPRALLDQLEFPANYEQLPFDAKSQLLDQMPEYRESREADFESPGEAIPSTRALKLRHRFWPTQARQRAKTPRGGFTFANKQRIKSLFKNTSPDTESQKRKEAEDGSLRSEATASRKKPRVPRATRLFDSFNALKFTVSFTFKLSELRNVLPPARMATITGALYDNTLNINKKLNIVQSQMADLDFDSIERLFFMDGNVQPIEDADARERLRNVWLGRPVWRRVEPDTGEINSPLNALPDDFNAASFKTLSGKTEENVAEKFSRFLTKQPTSNEYYGSLKSRYGENSISNNESANSGKLNAGDTFSTERTLTENHGVGDEISIKDENEMPQNFVGAWSTVNTRRSIPEDRSFICFDCMSLRAAGASAVEAASNFSPADAQSMEFTGSDFNASESSAVPEEVTSAAISLLRANRVQNAYKPMNTQSRSLEKPENAQEFDRVKVERINNLLKILRAQVLKSRIN